MWTVNLDGGPRRVNHAAAAVGQRIFSFGGYCTGDNYRVSTPIDVFVLTTSDYRWSQVAKPKNGDPASNDWPFQRYGHTVSPHGDRYIYLFGGRNDNHPCNVLFQFDTLTMTWNKPRVTGHVPAARDGHSACIINNALYIFGGYEESFSHYGPFVYKLDLVSMAWTQLECVGEPPIYRDFHSATPIGDYMFIFGGRSSNSNDLLAFNQDEIYSDKLSFLDTNTLTWHTPNILPPNPSGRRSHSAINLDGKLLIFGGYNGDTNEHKNDLWLLDPRTWKWSFLKPNGQRPSPRRRQALCQVGNQLFLFGGTSPYSGPKLYFTPAQLELMPDQTSAKLIDHNDLYVLDLSPSLRTLCLLAVIKHKGKIDETDLPQGVKNDLYYMTKGNQISKPLRTLPLG